jgi:hypothetical protein
MTSPEFGMPATAGGPMATSSIQGPCAPARADVDVRCADAERLLAAAQSHQVALREARRQHSDASRQRDADAKVRDRRLLAEEKNSAQVAYHAAIARAPDQTAVQDAAAAWLRRLDQLNRDAREADDRADGLAQRISELDRALPGLELAADAARISAEAAQVGCLDARRALAACEEQSGRSTPAVVRTVAPVTATPGASASAPAQASPAGFGQTGGTLRPAPGVAPSNPAPSDTAGIAAAASALMRGDRQTLLGLALGLAEETGFEAGRLQLLLLELREQIASRALEEHAFTFPPGHPFWSQFPTAAARNVAASLASMGYRFDGAGRWAEGRSPQIRDLALALSYAGYDPRSLRRPAGQAAIDGLWAGTTVRGEEYLLSRAPELTLAQIVALLGPRSGRLAELWDIWGRLRPLLIRTGVAPRA